jgi:4-alpha-glucanotransferase
LHEPVVTQPGPLPTGRFSGLLLHITSLPGLFGIGDLGPQAHAFAESLAGAGQRYWQVLPVGPTGFGNSPYSSLSSFAGNPLLIGPDLLLESGLIDRGDLDEAAMPEDGRVDYGVAYSNKLGLLAKAARSFLRQADPARLERFAAFKEREGPGWLDDYSLFTALKDAHDGRPWNDWEPEYARRHPAALTRVARELDETIETNRVVQFLFFEQWQRLRSVCRQFGVEMVGDLPLYVAGDSADVWANTDLFHLDSDGEPTLVAGVPPDYFSETGQRWGNPIFDWEKMASLDFTWWRARVRHALSLFDWLRIDHFRGIAGYWGIPASEPTAINGRWLPGPGASLLEAIRAEVGGLPIIAEDLGVITEDVITLRDGFGLPGMRVAQFGFDDAPDTPLHRPDNYPEQVWAYTGTHDNNTTLGWFWEGNPRHRLWRLDRRRRSLYRAVEGRIPWGLVEMVSRSRAMTSIFPVQDILGLGAEARMNTPGTAGGNWEWRLRTGQLDDDSLARLARLTRETGRFSVLP